MTNKNLFYSVLIVALILLFTPSKGQAGLLANSAQLHKAINLPEFAASSDIILVQRRRRFRNRRFRRRFRYGHPYGYYGYRYGYPYGYGHRYRYGHYGYPYSHYGYRHRGYGPGIHLGLPFLLGGFFFHSGPRSYDRDVRPKKCVTRRSRRRVCKRHWRNKNGSWITYNKKICRRVTRSRRVCR